MIKISLCNTTSVAVWPAFVWFTLLFMNVIHEHCLLWENSSLWKVCVLLLQYLSWQNAFQMEKWMASTQDGSHIKLMLGAAFWQNHILDCSCLVHQLFQWQVHAEISHTIIYLTKETWWLDIEHFLFLFIWWWQIKIAEWQQQVWKQPKVNFKKLFLALRSLK